MQAFYLYYVTWVLPILIDMCPMIFFLHLLICKFFVVAIGVDTLTVYYVRIITYVFVHQLLSNKGFGLRGFWWALAGFQWVTYPSLYPHLSSFILSSRKKTRVKNPYAYLELYVYRSLSFFFILSFITCRMPESKQSISYLLVADWMNWHFQARFSLALQRVTSPQGMLYCDEFQQPEFGKLKAT